MNQSDIDTGFAGLKGRGRKKQDPAIERELYLALEEVYKGCTKKMKISRRVSTPGTKFQAHYQKFSAAVNLGFCPKVSKNF